MPEVDPLIHQPTRLRIMAALAGLEAGSQVDFNHLISLLGLSDGNLSSHLQKLEAAGFVEIAKEFIDRHPRTWVRISAAGRRAFATYLETLEDIIGAGRPPAGTGGGPAGGGRRGRT